MLRTQSSTPRVEIVYFLISFLIFPDVQHLRPPFDLQSIQFAAMAPTQLLAPERDPKTIIESSHDVV